MIQTLILALGVLFVPGQIQIPEHAVARRFDAAIAARIPQARPERVSRNDEQELRRWIYTSGRITVAYLVHDSVEAAQEGFSYLAATLTIGTVPVQGLGDEAILMAPSDPSGQRRLNFRRGRVVVQVSAPGPDHDDVIRIAALFLEQIDRSARAGELDNPRR